MMTAQIKRLHSPDVYDLVTYVPSPGDKFGFLLQMIVGPDGEDSEESFDLTVCTPSWLAEKLGPSELLIGRHYLLIHRYEYPRLKRFLMDYCAKCEGQSWTEVAEKLGRIGKWEFEDYRG